MKLKLLFLSIFFFCFTNAQIFINNTVNSEICDSGNDGFEIIDLTYYNHYFSDNANYSFRYFANLNDAQVNVFPLSPSQIISGSTTFYVRVENLQDDFAIGLLNIIFKNNCVMSVSEIVSEKIRIYPNPFIHFVHIKTEKKFIKAELFSILGERLSSSKDEIIDLSKLKSGVYILKVFTDKSKQSFKILKK